MRARRRQAQRPRQCRLHRAPPHLLRDARQFLVRRLLQGPRHRARLDADHQGIRSRSEPPDGDGLPHRRRGGGALEEDRRPARRTHRQDPDQRQFLGHGRYRPVRSVLGNLLRSRCRNPRRTARQPGRGRRPLHRDLEPGLHAIRPGDEGGAPRPAAPVDRHRHGAGAHRRGPAGRPRQLRHRPVQGADPRLGGGHRRARRGQDPRQPPRHCRPPARLELPDRRRRAAVQRGPRLRAAPHHAPRHAPRPVARRRGAADVAAGAGAGPRDGPGLSGARARRAADRRDAEARGDPLPQDAGARPRPAVGRHRRPCRGRSARRRDRLQALRHLWFPARSHAGRIAPARHRRRHRGLPRRHGTAEGGGARRLGRFRRGCDRSRLVRGARPSRARPSSSATRPNRPRA